MASVTSATPGQPPFPPPVPPLQAGDLLTRDEFERRYNAMPHVRKAELIDGVVYMPSPVKHNDHSNPHFNMITWLGIYAGVTPGVDGGDNGSLRLDTKSEPQPDGYLIIRPDHQGQVQIDSDGYIVGGPELIAEVAATSANYDLHGKLRTYERNRVGEYVVWRVFDRAIDWFVQRHGGFEALPMAEDGTCRSEVFPGLRLNPTDLITGNLQAIVQAAPLIQARPEHVAFVARLQQAASSRKD